MKLQKPLIALWAAFVLSCLISIVFGESGIIATSRLEAEKERLAENMTALRRLNGELEGSLQSLTSDPDALTLRAREMGYSAASDERYIRIPGLAASQRRTAQAGNYLRAAYPAAIPDSSIRIIGTVSGVLLFVLLTLRERRRRS
jgi:cell division protein FtsB